MLQSLAKIGFHLLESSLYYVPSVWRRAQELTRMVGPRPNTVGVTSSDTATKAKLNDNVFVTFSNSTTHGSSSRQLPYKYNRFLAPTRSGLAV